MYIHMCTIQHPNTQGTKHKALHTQGTHVHEPALVLHEPHGGAVPGAAQPQLAGVQVHHLVRVRRLRGPAAQGWGLVFVWGVGEGRWVDGRVCVSLPRSVQYRYVYCIHSRSSPTGKGVLHLLEGAPRDAGEEARLGPAVHPWTPVERRERGCQYTHTHTQLKPTPVDGSIDAHVVPHMKFETRTVRTYRPLSRWPPRLRSWGRRARPPRGPRLGKYD